MHYVSSTNATPRVPSALAPEAELTDEQVSAPSSNGHSDKQWTFRQTDIKGDHCKRMVTIESPIDWFCTQTNPQKALGSTDTHSALAH